MGKALRLSSIWSPNGRLIMESFFSKNWLILFVDEWNKNFSIHHPRFSDHGRVAFVVEDAELPFHVLIGWNDNGQIVLAEWREGVVHPADCPAFVAPMSIWKEYSQGEKSGAFFVATRTMRYEGSISYLLTKGLLFDVVAKCAGLIQAT